MSYKLWTAEEEAKVRELVSLKRYSYRQIGALMGRSINSVTSHCRQYLDVSNSHYSQRKYHHIQDFFKVPNVVNSYIAGFWAADGCMTEGKEGYRLRLEISADDESHLQWIKDTLGHEATLSSWGEKKTKFFQMYITNEYGKQMIDNFGLMTRKTYRLTPPALGSFEFEFAYLLGLLDGDGCVHLNVNQKLMLTYCSASLVAVRWVQSMIESMGFPQIKKKPPFKIKDLRPQANAWSFACTGARTVCLVQLAQEFARRHNLPILARKWNNDRLNQYIDDFYARFPDYHFDPVAKLDELIVRNAVAPSPQSPEIAIPA